MSATPTEITRDIIIAMIQRNTSSLGIGEPQTAAQQIAQVFEIVHKKVIEKYQQE